MLERLTIRNIALIRNQSIEFTNGLNVLTGETGAGKSLIIDSLSLLLGEKADKTLISHGEKFASVEAVFGSLTDYQKSVMEELGLEDEEELIISRKISVDGKNECRVNGNLFTLSMLKKISAPLMDLHGQFEHQNLLKINNHINILDLYGGQEVLNLKEQYCSVLSKYKDVLEEISNYTVDDSEREKLIELYDFQIKEIDDAGFYVGEEEELKDFRNQVLHQEKILESLSNASNIIGGNSYESQGVSELIKKAENLIGGISNYFKDAEDFFNRLESLKIELDDIKDSIDQKLDSIYFDEQKAIENEKRLDLLSAFKKKYGFTIEEIVAYRDKIKTEQEKLIGSKDRVNELKQAKIMLESNLKLIGLELSTKRKSVAKVFEKEVVSELKALGMKSANFVVDFQEIGIESLNKYGLDRVEFMFSANLGESVKPLKNVASGGEMSRFMLAVKNITAKLEGISTLIFDEIDTGVSGQIALVLGEKLAKVSLEAQVICVTHLSQIASYGINHLFISKFEKDGFTNTEVKALNKKERIEEIARLISGNITESALKHAEEMLEKGDNFYKSL